MKNKHNELACKGNNDTKEKAKYMHVQNMTRPLEHVSMLSTCPSPILSIFWYEKMAVFPISHFNLET